MVRIKIVYDKENCIGAASCSNLYPEFWLFKDDEGKVDLIGSTKISEKEYVLELNCTEEELKKHIDAAVSCPVNVIHIYNLDTGKQLI